MRSKFTCLEVIVVVAAIGGVRPPVEPPVRPTIIERQQLYKLKYQLIKADK